MVTLENEHYLRTIMLFSIGSSYVSKPILRRELKRHSNDLNSLLLDYKSKLIQEFEPDQFDKLFPAGGKSDVDSWDIHMLTGMILNLFRTSLSLEERKNLMIIKSLWKEFMVLSDSVSPEEQYEDMQALLKDTLTSLSSGCDQSVQETCKAYIDKFSNGPFDKEAARRDLQQMQINDDFIMKVLKKWEKECMSNQIGIDIDESRTFASTESKTEDCTSFIEVEIDAGAMASKDRKERNSAGEIVLIENDIYKEKTVANTEHKAEELCTLILEDDTGKARAMTITDCEGIDCTSILEADFGEAGAMAITDCKEVDFLKADEVDINEEVETRTECKAEEGCTEAAESGNSDTCNIDRTFRKSFRVLVSLMDPDLILDNAECNRILTYQQTKDIRELITTSDKNRKIIERVRKRGKNGYTTFKECLKKTNQSFIVRVLECFETDGDSPEALDEPYVLEEVATAVKNRDLARLNTDLILRDAFPFLVTFMTPDPILDNAECTRLLSYMETRDIRDRETTSDKNRNIIEKVRQKGKEGYEQFKECLKRTQQLEIVEYLECSERQDLFESLATKIEETRKKGVIEKRLRNQLMPNFTEKLNEIPAKNRSTQINLSTPTEIIIRGPSEKVIIWCEEELNVCFNNYKNSAEGNAEEIQQHVNDLLADVEEGGSIIFKSSERKCIILQFECKTYAAVLRFLNYMTSEQLHTRLYALANSLRRKLQLKDELYITAKIPITCLDTLQNVFELGIAVPQEQQYGDLAFDDDSKIIYKPMFERTLTLDLECTSTKGLSRLWNTFQKGRISKTLNGIAEMFTRRYNTQVSLTSSVNLTEFRDALDKSYRDYLSELPTVRCVQHDRDFTDMYCLDHKVFGCIGCLILDHRFCRIASSLDNVKKDFKETDLTNTKENVLKASELVFKIKHEREKNLLELQKSRAEALDSIKTFHEDMQLLLESFTKGSVNDAEQKYNMTEKDLRREKEEAEEQIETLRKASAYLQSFEGDRLLAFMVTAKKINTNVEYVSKHFTKEPETKIKFSPYISVSTCISDMQSFGSITIETASTGIHRSRNTLYSVKGKREMKVKSENDASTCMITDSCLTEDGLLLLVDYWNKTLKQADIVKMSLLDTCDLPDIPTGVCCIDKQEAVVCLYNNTIQFVFLGNRLICTKQKKLNHFCGGIAYYNNLLYITDNSKQLFIHDTSGNLLQTISRDSEGNKIFKSCHHIEFDDFDGNKLLIADYVGLVTIYLNGKHVNTLKDADLINGIGVCSDRRGNSFVCGYSSNNVVQVAQSDNRKLGVVVSRSHGVKCPRSVCFDPTRSVLIVTQDADDCIQLFDLQ